MHACLPVLRPFLCRSSVVFVATESFIAPILMAFARQRVPTTVVHVIRVQVAGVTCSREPLSWIHDAICGFVYLCIHLRVYVHVHRPGLHDLKQDVKGCQC